MRESTPGMRASRPYIDYPDYSDNPLHLLPQHEAFLIRAIEDVDRDLTHEAILLAKGDRGEFLKRLLNHDECEQAIRDTVQSAYEIIRDRSNIYAVFPIAGAIPLANRMRSLGLEHTRIAPIEVSGTSGTVTGEAKVRHMPLSLASPHFSVLIIDDIGDSFVSAAAIALERKKQRMRENGEVFDPTPWRNFLADLAGASRDSDKDMLTYRVLSRLLQIENVFVLPVFHKNQNAIDAISDLANRSKDKVFSANWGSIQAALFDGHFPHTIPSDEWVLGAGLLDIGIHLTDVKNKLSEQERQNLVVGGWDAQRVLLRIGVSIPGLVSIHPEKIDDLTFLLAQKIEAKL